METKKEILIDEVIEKRKEAFASFFKSEFSILTYIILLFLVWINVHIRTLPMRIIGTGNPGLWDITRNSWTLGPDLDPFLFLRYAKNIVENGTLTLHDMMRYLPLGYNTAEETRLLPYMIAYLHKIINFFGSTSLEYSAVIFPVVASVFMVVAFFLLVRKLFQKKGEKFSNITALVASALLIVLPALLSRTIAGIPEKESAGFGLMFFALWLFLCSWDAKRVRYSIILGVLAGAFTAMMGLIWGGVTFIYASLAIAGFAAFLLEKIELKEIMSYGSWLVSSAVFWIPFTQRVDWRGFLASATTGGCVIVFFFMIVYYAINKTKLKEINILQNEKMKKLPKPFTAIIISVVLLTIISTLVLGPRTIPRMVESVFEDLIRPYEDRLAFTVAENKQPFFTEWKDNMGPVINGAPLFFWLFFFGSLYLLYELISGLEKKEKILTTAAYTFFLISLVFSRSSPSSIFNGDNAASLTLYALGYIVLAGSFGFLFYKRYNAGKEEVFKLFSFDYILVFSLSFIGIIAARSAIRLVMVLTAVATIATAYLIVETTARARRTSGDAKKVIAIVIAAIILIAGAYTFMQYYKISITSAQSYIPSGYTLQWQKAMQWVRNSTEQNAVFAHWWDYGYWIQSMGERATVLDGGNAISYWNHLIGRHVLTGKNEKDALEFMYAHNVSYLLIDSTDIGKYPAYAMIGSDANYDRQSAIPTIIQDTKSTQETKNETILVYRTGFALDEDLVLNEGNNPVFLPAGQAAVGAILLHMQNESLTLAEEIVVYQGKQYNIPIKYVYYKGKLIKFDNGTETGVFLFPFLIPQGNSVQVNHIGAMLYLSKRVVNSGVARYYLFGQESDNIKVAHIESALIVEQLKSQGADIGEFVFLNGQGMVGPIKIWKITYPRNIQYKPEYLNTTFPSEAIRVARQ